MENKRQYDVVCIGFGPAALSVGIALHEQTQPLRVLFLERNSKFSWIGDRMPDDTISMRTTLLQDLVTQRNPLSRFTFINYLWSSDRLVAYTNLGLTHPPRLIFSQYLSWCAHQLEKLGWVQYGQEAVQIEPVKSNGEIVSLWRVRTKDLATGAITSVLANNVITAVGTQPKSPKYLSGVDTDNRILHSMQFSDTLPRMRQWPCHCPKIAIIGENHEAVEIFEHCRSLALQWDANVTLFTGNAAFRQTDVNPLSVFLLQISLLKLTAHSVGELVANTNKTPFEHRDNRKRQENSVQNEALNSLYLKQYEQLVRQPDTKAHRFHVRTSCDVVKASRIDSSNQVVLYIRNPTTANVEESGPFDFVFVASGYEKRHQQNLLEPLRTLCDSREGHFSVDEDYRAIFKRESVSRSTGVWVLDAFENGNNDAFAYLALRTQRVVSSLLESYKAKEIPVTVGQMETAERSVL
jgi:L-ornithine N5-oxygenase